MNKKLVLIDLDDTLWDTWSNNKESLKEVYTALHWGRYFSCFESFFEQYYYPVNHALWEKYNKQQISKQELSIERLYRPFDNRLKHLRLDDAMSETCRNLEELLYSISSYWEDANDAFLGQIKRKTRLCPGALDLLSYLKTKYHICILSNGFGEVQYAKINNSGLSPYIDDIILSDEVGYNKPHPHIFEYSLRTTGYNKSDSIMIGDSWSSDIRGAALAGIDSIWYNRYGLETPLEENITPLTIVRSLNEITQML